MVREQISGVGHSPFATETSPADTTTAAPVTSTHTTTLGLLNQSPTGRDCTRPARKYTPTLTTSPISMAFVSTSRRNARWWEAALEIS